MPSLTSLEPAFFHCGVHPFLSMLLLRSPSLTKVRLSLTLTLSHFPIWRFGQRPLFRFFLTKVAPRSGVLANCSICGTEATFFYSAGPVSSSFSAEICAILQALCWSRQHQQVCHFSSLLLLSDSRSVLATLSSPPSFVLPQFLWQIWPELPSLSSCSIRLPWVLDTRFSRVTMQLMSWPDRERYSCPQQL